MGKKGLVGELGLIPETDPVSGLIISHCMLQDHDFKHLLGLGMREFTLADKGGYAGRQGMDTLIRELADVREQFILEMPEMLISLYSSADGIMGFPEHLLFSRVMVPLSMRDWRVCVSLPPNIIFSCFQPVWQSSASSVLMSRASRQYNALV